MSPPAENALSPAPVMTRQPIASSASSSLHRVEQLGPELAVHGVEGLGLLSVTMPTPSSRSTRMCSYAIALTLLWPSSLFAQGAP
jgi:hypothetical protein